MLQPSDSQIQTDVLDELKWEPRVRHEAIGVAVHKGIVALSGNVPNYAEKLAAEHAVMRVRGVKGIAEEIEVRNEDSKKNDPEIAEAATRALGWHVWTPDGIKVTVQKGWVTLTGDAEFDHQRKSAVDSVRFLDGVTGVTNDIKVTSRVDLKNVHKRIEEALVRGAELESGNVTVSVQDGTVTLSGYVNSYSEKQAAGSAAWRAPGVCSVINELHVGSPQSSE